MSIKSGTEVGQAEGNAVSTVSFVRRGGSSQSAEGKGREGRSRRELELTISRPSLPLFFLLLLQYITANIRNVFGGAETLGLSTSVGTKTRSSFEVSSFLVPFPYAARVDEPKLTSSLCSLLLLTPGNSSNTFVCLSFTFPSSVGFLVRSRQHGVRFSLGAGSGSKAQLRREFSFLLRSLS